MSSAEPVEFVWTDLAATDSARAVEFYTSLFGWRVESVKLAENHHYLTFLRGDDPVCGVFQMSPDQLALGGTSFWTSYLKVPDVDGVSAVARMQGATVLVDPFDMGEKGRTAVLQDPGGAVFAIRDTFERGVKAPRGVGSIDRFELRALDPASSSAFYRNLFQWDSRPLENGASGSWAMSSKNERQTTVSPLTRHGDSTEAIPQWVFHVLTESLEKTSTRALELGAVRISSEQGATSLFLDPIGSLLGLAQEDAPL